MAREDEEEESGVQEEAMSAHSSPQDTQASEEKCGGNSAEFEDGLLGVQETLSIKDDDCNFEQHVDDVEGVGAMEDEPTAIATVGMPSRVKILGIKWLQ